MKLQWQEYSDKYLQMTSREQILILLTGVVAIFFIISYLFIDEKSEKIVTYDKRSASMQSTIKGLDYSIQAYQDALKEDPEVDIIQQIELLESKLTSLDKQLLMLTTELISPVEMREALLKLLKLQPGVSLLSFELIGAEPLLNMKTEQTNTENGIQAPTPEQLGVNLYKHGIKIKLTGEYFQLRNYLRQLEQLPWKFFWQDFQLVVKEYPNNEVDIVIYSLGLNKEFIGV